MMNSVGGSSSSQLERDLAFLRRLAGARSDAAPIDLAASIRLLAVRPRKKGAAEAAPSALWKQWEDQRSCLSRS